MTSPLVSIVVPVHNAEQTLKKCVGSLTSQTFNNIEILLINNGSTDKSWETCQKLASDDSRIKAINHFEKGVSTARNRGIDESIGNYVMFVDADDWIDSNACELFANLNAQYNYDLFCFSAQYHRSRKTTKTFLFGQDIVFFNNAQKEELQLKVLAPKAPFLSHKVNTRFAGSACGKIYKRDILKKNQLHFATETIISEDCLFNTLSLDFFQRIGFTRNTFYHYEQHHDSAQNHYRPNSEKYFEFVILQIQQWLLQTKKNKFYIDSANCLFTHYLFGILKEDLVHKGNGLSFNQRCKAVSQLFAKEKIQNILKNANTQYFSLPENALIFLMKKKIYKLTVFLLEIYLK